MKDFLPEKQQAKKNTRRKRVKKSSSKTSSRIIFYLLPLLFTVITLDIQLTKAAINAYIQKYAINSIPFQVTVSAPYPIYQPSASAVTDISALAAVVMDNYSKVIVFSKNPYARFPMASTTKIMTALVALDYYQLNDVLTIQSEYVEGVNVGFQTGEKILCKELLYAMLLPSGNDAALALAQNYPGGQEAFVKKMNEKAMQLHLLNTHFEDPTGLEDGGDYTTVIDLVRLASVAMEHDTFAHIVKTKHTNISTVDGSKTYLLYNLNKLLDMPSVTGVKTGFTEGALGVLVTSSTRNGHMFIIVVMKSKDRFADTETLLSAVTQNVSYATFSFEK